ncbi:ABC transporter ATP-binding protein [Streptomyces sp. ISL-10]|uniref:ABC transporter ATP-binding protein n=1 Tax=Streptomyces sp. ISL-10 TaxID=2819172 RepID=UPI001BEBD94F|nr:ABC transporter ATP-binding protein [Streptomyces sp. ISL-10]MBT2365571.1 ABC transporter ATP-binding protein [Streptomyces sp. ISL-10]
MSTWSTASTTSTPALVVDGVGREFVSKKSRAPWKSRAGRTGGVAVTALSDVSFRIGRGEVVGMLGQNGAGKTTLLRIVSTLLLPTRGRVLVDGVDVETDPKEARTRLSVVFGGDRGLYPRLTALDNATLFGALSGIAPSALERTAREALASVGLLEVADRAVGAFSKGMKQRLHLGIGLMTRPALVMLDEPTVGLDPLEAERLREAVAKLPDEGISVLLTSHYLQDIERLAARVVILRGGRITHDMPLAELVEQSGDAATVTVVSAQPPAAAAGSEDASGIRVRQSAPFEGQLWRTEFEVAEWTGDSLAALSRMWPSVGVRDVRVRAAGLEQVFSRLTEDGPEART